VVLNFVCLFISFASIMGYKEDKAVVIYCY
jgi:hypothetical protein